MVHRTASRAGARPGRYGAAMAGRSLRTGLSWNEVLAVFWTLAVAWLLATTVFVGALVADAWSSDEPSACSLSSGNSTEGTAHWSWGELGTVCRWDLPVEGPLERGPGVARWGVAAGLAGWGLTVLFLGSLLFDLTDRARARTARRDAEAWVRRR